MLTYTQETFEATSWHDNYVHGFRFVQGTDGTGELHIELDHILEWMDGDEASFLFRVAPATLRFFGVINLKIQLDYSAAAMGPFQIDGIDRRIEQRGGREAVIWSMGTTYPDGEIEFEATGYVQVLNGPPLVVKRQWLIGTERGDA